MCITNLILERNNFFFKQTDYCKTITLALKQEHLNLQLQQLKFFKLNVLLLKKKTFT